MLALLFLASVAVGCQPGSGAECASADDCPAEQECLTAFAGGYCGLEDCESDDDCPSDSMCVSHEGSTYCFLTCTDKPQCNGARSADNEANCSSNVDPVDDNDSRACVPPSSGN
jgi:hypothetical protein